MINMKDEIMKIRAHHGMCLAFFEGKGYSDGFTEHMQIILDKMQSNPKLQIVAKGDIICKKCPNLKDGVCNTPDLVQEYDRQVLLRCGLKENTEINWEEFSKLVTEKILAKGKRQEICGNCQWTEICQRKEKNFTD